MSDRTLSNMPAHVSKDSSSRARTSIPLAEKCLYISILAICFQNISFLNFGEYASLKLYHIIIPLICIISFAQRRENWKLPSLPIFFTYIGIILISFLNVRKFGISSVLISYSYMFLCIALVWNLAECVSQKRVEEIVQNCALTLVLLIIIRVVGSGSPIDFFSNDVNYHLDTNTYIGGGVNLEATWVAIFCIFFNRDFKGVFYCICAGFVCIAYASRAGLVLYSLALIYLMAFKGVKVGLKQLGALLLACIVIIIALYILYENGFTVIERFLTSGDDNGMRGRNLIWENIGSAWLKAPGIGAGAGNGIRLVETVSNIDFYEDNVHNYYAQVLLDFGILGALVFFCYVFAFLRQVFREKTVSASAAAIALYLCASFIQFRGGDVILGIFIGLYLVEIQKTGKAADRTVDHSSDVSSSAF